VALLIFVVCFLIIAGIVPADIWKALLLTLVVVVLGWIGIIALLVAISG
jgi:hypothetical protein